MEKKTIDIFVMFMKAVENIHSGMEDFEKLR